MLFRYVKWKAIRWLIRAATALIPSKQLRGNIRRALLNRFPMTSLAIHTSPLRIYPPIYSRNILPESEEPVLYNQAGERVHTYFFRDYYIQASRNMASRYFQFERFNIGLDTHFYGHMAMLEQMGKPVRRYGYLLESKGIVPEIYSVFDKHSGLHKDFDLIFTHDYDIIVKYDNARFWPSCAFSWIPPEHASAALIDEKARNASIVSSHKSTCRLHDARTAAAQYCKNNYQRLGVDAFGTFDGGQPIQITDSLIGYRYSIAVENYISPYFFTEKIINCFLTCTIPVYVGATEIGKFFNLDGIIQISPNDLTNMDPVVAQCSPADYEARRGAILDNFNKALEYTNAWDYLYVNYLHPMEGRQAETESASALSPGITPLYP